MSDEMDEIWSLYADDGAQAMDAMEAALLALEDAADADQSGHVAALFRAVHTFKGNSRVLGLGVVESRAHLAEDLIGLVRDAGVPLDGEILALLLETGDWLRSMLETTASTRADVDPAETEELMVRLRDKIARCSGQAGAEALPAPPPEPIHDPKARPAVPEDRQDPEPEADLSDEEPLQPGPENTPDAAGDLAAEAEPPVSAKPKARLADDPTYRAIFADMVRETVTRLRNHQTAGTPEATRRPVADLEHAAIQMGLDDWSGALSSYPTPPSAEDLAALLSTIETLSATMDLAAPPPATGSEGAFFDAISDALATISRLGISLTIGETTDPEILEQAAETVASAADAEGYVRVAAIARVLPKAQNRAAHRRTELRLYEELAAVEAVLPSGTVSEDASPARLLANWSADHIFDTLDDFNGVLAKLRTGNPVKGGHRALEWLIRLVHHACRHYELDMASQLAMSLLDLFGRSRMQGTGPDAILLRIAQGFADTLELVFDALREGEVPDIARLEQLFAEASESSFSGSGVMTATSIERKLGLPTEFHRVLSPESVKAASVAMAEGHRFHILRADVNTDNGLAEELFAYIGSGAIRAITNVTVFRGQETLFDFLIATRLDLVDLTEALARMDPEGTRLILLQSLTPLPDGAEALGETASPERGQDGAFGSDLSANVLEQIGEIAAGQAMVHGMLNELADYDMADTIDAVLRQNGNDPRQARLALRALADDTMTKLRELAQLETQLLAQMAELQQTTAELRARPIETILRPLAALIETQSRSNGQVTKLTFAGSDMTLDIALLESLKRVLRPLALACIAPGNQGPRRIHVVVNRHDDHLSVTLDHDGSTPPDPDLLGPVEADATRAGGLMRQIALPGGGQRFHLALPMNLVVLEGMVVGVGNTRYVLPVEAIRTILQPDPSMMLQFSAQGNQRWLRFGEDEVIAIRPLGEAGRETTLTTEAGAAQGNVHVVLGRAGQSVAIPVDQLVGQQLVFLRPLRGLMSKLRNVAGVALLTGGDVGIVLSPGAICGVSETSEGLAMLSQG